MVIAYIVMILAMNKSEIITLAIHIVNTRGLQDLTISEIAKEFKVKPPSLYKHIRNLNEIYDELGTIFIREAIRIIQHNVFGLSGEKAIKEASKSFRDFSIKNPGLYQCLQLTHIHRSPQYQQDALSFIELLARLIAPYKIRNNHQIHAIRSLRCLLHGFIDLQIQNGFGLPEDIDKSFELAMDGYLLSLSKIY